ncbi:MAG: hypothetical protein JST81_13860, partial [Bacteroidetes bacterium]|nr:hypothetical protein [Bacteroidota bacterium]
MQQLTHVFETGKKINLNKKQFRFVIRMFMLVCLFCSFLNSRAQYFNVPVTGYNTDVVANGVGAASASTSGTFDNTQYTLAASDWNFTGSCSALSFFMPTSGTVNANSTIASGLVYNLQPYNANNDLRIPATGSGAGSGTLTLVTPVSASKLFLLYGVGNGPITAGINVTVTFTDLSTQVFTGLTGLDWFATTNPAISNLGRIDRNATPACVNTSTGGPQLFDLALQLNGINFTKLVQSITVEKTTSGNTLNIMAVGMQSPCAVPGNGPTGFTQGATTISSIAGSFTAATSAPTGYLVVGYPNGATPVDPVNGTTYTTGNILGTGNVIQSSASTSFSTSGLTANTTYDGYIYSYNTGATCGGPIYNKVDVLSGSLTTSSCSGLPGGTYSVGPTGNYTSIGAALTAISGGITGPVILELEGTYLSSVESFPIVFPSNACIGPVNSLTIRPSASATNLSITSSNVTGTINFNGATYVTIDGRPGGTGTTSQLTVSNTNAGTSYAVQFTGDARFNTIKYTTVTSRNTSAASGTIVFTGGLVFGNDLNTIDNCSILDGSSTPLNAIYSAGTSTSVDNSNNTISNCNIANYFGAATASNGIFLASNSSGWTISNNKFYQTVSRTPTTGTANRAIQILTASGGNYTISGNIIGYASNTGTGTTTYAGAFANRFVGIEITSSNSLVSSIQGNTITNISVTSSTAGAQATPVFGGIVILGGNHNIGTITGNTIGAATGTGAIAISSSVSSYYVDGIYSTSTGTVTISNNNIGSINATGTTASVSCLFYGIWCLGTSGNATVTNNVVGSTSTANSIVVGTDLTSTASHIFYGIRCDNTGTPTVGGGSGLGNTVQNVTVRTTGSASFYGYYNGSTSVAPVYSYNTLTGVAMGWTTTNSTGTFYGMYNGTTLSSLLTISNNSFQNITNLNISGTMYITYNSNSTPNVNFQNNTINNITRASGLNGTMYCFYNGSSPTGIQNFTGNTITNLSTSATSGTGTFYGLYNLTSSSSTWNVISNTVSQITAGSGGGYGLYIGYGNVTCNGNTVNNFATSGTTYGIYLGGSVTTGGALFNNTVYSISSSGTSSTVYGINTAATSPTIYKNKVYDISSSGTAGIVYGIYTNGGTTLNIYNNLVGDLRATASSLTAPAPSVAGLYINSGTTVNAYYNTIQLNASSTGTNFGTAAVYTTSTPTTINLRNNIFSNTSTASGTGKTVAFQRASTALTNYAATANNNLFYGGIAGASNLIYFDGTNADQTIGTFKTRMSTRDQASVAENPPFLSVSGGSSNFLHINTATSTQIESGAAPIATFTDDFDGDTRNVSTPDIGADEFNGVAAVVVSINSISINPTGNLCSPALRTVTANTTAGNSAITTVTINYSLNGVSQSPITMTGGDPSIGQTSTWTGTIPVSGSGVTVAWSVSASDAITTKSSTGTPYTDDPLSGVTLAASVSANPVCALSATNLSALAFKPGQAKTVGAGATTTATYPNPIYSNWANNKMQILYRASELTAAGLAAGNITALSFPLTSTSTTGRTNFTINIAHTSATVVSTTFLTPTFTQVYTTASYVPFVGTNSFAFGTGAGSSSSFNWDGTSNLLLQICWDNTASTATEASTAVADNTSFVSVVSYNRTSTTGTPVCGITVTGTSTYSVRPTITFTGTGSSTLTSYSWSDGTNTVGTGNPLTVYPPANTTYTVTGTDANGCTVVSSPLTVNTTALPASPGGNNSTQCGTAAPAAFVTTAGGGAGFKWYDAQIGGTLLQSGGALYTTSISTTTHFWVSESDGTCESARTEVIATVNTPDPVTASSNGPICLNSSLQLTATVTNGTNGNNYNYVWTANPATGSGIPSSQSGGVGTFGSPSSTSVTPTAAGTYTYTVTGTDATLGCVTIATVIVTVKPLPFINSVTATPTTVCAGTNVTLNGTTSTASSQTIQVGSGTGTVGTTTAVGALYGGYWGNGHAQVLFRASELTALGFLPGNLTGLSIDISSLPTSPAVSTYNNYTIKIGSTSATAITTFQSPTFTTVFGPTSYTPVVGNNVHPFSTPFNWDGVSNIIVDYCFSNQVTGTVGSPQNTITVTSFGSFVNYNADGSGGAGACTTTTVSNASSNRPNIKFTGQVGSIGAGSLNWTWNPGSVSGANVIVNPTTTTVYTVTATDPVSSCSSTATVNVTVNPIPPAPSGNNGTDQCGTALTDASVSSNATDPQSPAFFKWYLVPTGGTPVQTGNPTTFIQPISSTTDFYVSEVSVNGCEGPRVHISTIVSDPDILTVTTDAPSNAVCANGSFNISSSYTPNFNAFATFELTASGGAASGVTGTVSLTPNGTGDGSDPYSVTPTATGSYTYTITAIDPDKGCTSVGTVVVTVNALPLIEPVTASATTVCSGTSVTLNGSASTQYLNVPVTGFNQDVVANGTGAASASTTSTFDNAQYTLAASDWNFSGSCAALTNYMPVNRQVPANPTVAIGLIYQLQSYNANNDLRIPATGSGTGSGTLTLVTPVKMKNLYLLYAVGNGPITSGINVTVNFTDASSQSFTGLTGLDWFASTNPAIQDLGRIDRTVTPACATTTTGGPRLFDLALAISAGNYNKLVQSIDIAVTSGTSTLNIMAVGRENPDYTAQGTLTWGWQPGSLSGASVTVNPTTTTTYTATATNSNGCNAQSTITVNVNPLPNNPIGSNSSQCGLHIPTASVTTGGGGGNGTFNWYSASTGGTLLQSSTSATYTTAISSTTTFYVSEMGTNGCESGRTAVTVTVSAPPTVNTTGSTTAVCLNGNVTLNASSTETGYSYVWTANPSTGSGITGSLPGSALGTSTNTITPTAAGTYTYTVTASESTNGCANAATVITNVNPLPPINSVSASATTVCAGVSTTLSATAGSFAPGQAVSGVNSGTTTTSSTIGAMYGLYYGNGHAQALYTAAELSAAGMIAGNITSISTNVGSIGNGTALQGYTIKIAATNATSLSAFLSPTFTTVFGPANYNPVVGTNTHTFATPFVWDGTSNILIDYCFSNQITGTSTTAVTSDYTTTGYNSFINYQVDGTTGATACTTTTVTNTSANRPLITFGGIVGTDVTGTFAWQWNPGALSGSSVVATPTSTTVYTVTATNPVTSCSAQTTITVNVNQLPNNPIGSNSSQCGFGVPSASVTTGGGGGNGTFNWYSASTGGTLLQSSTSATYTTPISSTTTFYVSEMGTNGCEGGRTPVTVTVSTPPTVNTTGSTSVVCLNGTVTLNATSSETNYSYVWTANPSTGSGITGSLPGSASGTSSNTITPTAAGSYTYTVTASETINGCSNTATVIVTVNPNPPVNAVAANPPTICAGGSTTLSGTAGTFVPGTTTVGTTTTSIGGNDGNPYRSGNGTGNQIRTQLLYTAAELTAAGLTQGNITSIGFTTQSSSTGTVTGFTIEMGTTAVSSLTSTFETTPMTTVFTQASFTPLSTGLNVHTFSTPFFWNGTSNIIVNICQTNSISGTATVSAYTPSYASNTHKATSTTSCTSATGTAVATKPITTFGGQIGTNVTGNYNWVWNPGNLSGSSVVVSPTTTSAYTATATDPITGCFTVSAPVTVSVTPVGANASASPSTPVCAGSSVTLSAGATGGSPFTYSWASTPAGTYTPNVNGNITVNPTVTTTYTVTVTDACSNSTTSSVTVTVNPLPTVGITPSATTYCNPGGVVPSLTANGALTYTWSPSVGLSAITGGTVSASPSATTVYTVTGTDGNGCQNTGTATVTVNPNVTGLTASVTPTTICAGSNLSLSSSATLNGAVSGYTMNANSGVAFVDISATGTSVGTLSDDSEHNISIPSFSFDGVVYTAARVGTNGAIVLGATTGEITFSNVALPSTGNSAGNIFLAPWWDDLDVNLGGTIKTQTVGNKFIIEYDAIDHNSFTTGTVTFEVQLDLLTNQIHFVYQDVIFGSSTYDAGASATVGIQRSSSSAVQYSLNTASLTNGQSITFTPTYTQLPINYTWSGPGGFNSTQQNPTAIASVTGTYTVTATAASGSGCSATTTTATVTVNPRPTATISGSGAFCQN